jgi:hypothetical protein
LWFILPLALLIGMSSVALVTRRKTGR